MSYLEILIGSAVATLAVLLIIEENQEEWYAICRNCKCFGNYGNKYNCISGYFRCCDWKQCLLNKPDKKEFAENAKEVKGKGYCQM